ncbi:leucine-rich repeat domain-containing protein [Dongia deserti]|uniref:hypothetical protein n=1 Tax=Dongia deserti TaxID=2268030 RepID=UPI000E64B011|nr:hypothetical protein [Dongia deserti]
MLQVPQNEPLRTSLAGVDRGLKTLWVDGTAKDFAALQEFQALTQLTVYRLPRRHVPVLAGCRLPRLTTLSLRHADAEDLQFLGKLATLETLTVWQSRKLKRLDGVERLTRLAELYLNDVGAIESLAPLEPLTGLRILALTGGVQTTQVLPPLAPLRALVGLEQLHLTAAKVSDGDLSPLADLKQLTRLELSPRTFEPAEIAYVAAAHPFFLRDLLALPDFDAWAGAPGCKKCKSGRKVLFLRSKKLLWCPQCEGVKLKALVAEFEQLVEEKRRERAGGR